MNGITYLLDLKNKLKAIYTKYSYALHMIFKFVLAFLVFAAINEKIGSLKLLNSMYPVVLFALICSLLSVKSIVVFGALMILGHSFSLGLEVLAFSAVFMILLFLFFIRFDEKDSVALLLTPLGIAFGVPCFIPICFGLKGKMSSAVSVACGSVLYSFIQIISDKMHILQNAEAEDMLVNLQILIDGVLQNKSMVLSAIVLAAVVLIVNVVKRLPVDYSWHAAIGVGAVVYLIAFSIGGMYLNLDLTIGKNIISTLIAIVLALIVEVFVLNVDYSRTERMEFEDDEYYYYVKAVPKMSISEANREIKKITIEEEPVITEESVVAEEEVEIDMMPQEVIPDVAKKLEDSLNDL